MWNLYDVIIFSVSIEGNLQKLFHMFDYMKIHHNYVIIMDPTYLDID